MGVGALAVAMLFASACGTANDYSSEAINEFAAAQAGIDPNRDPVDQNAIDQNAVDQNGLDPNESIPDQLAFVDESEESATPDVDDNTDDHTYVNDGVNSLVEEDRQSLPAGVDDNQRQDSLTPRTPDRNSVGQVYQRCVVDYGNIDWSAPPAEVAALYTAASAEPCASEKWYEATAFQNGILIFMVITGEQDTVAAAPSSAGAEETVASLIAQGYASVERMEIASTGSCENGEVQLAILELREGIQLDPAGMDEIVASADDVGALVDQREGITLIAGGGSPCVSGIVVKPDLVAWFTSSDTTALLEAAEFLTLQ